MSANCKASATEIAADRVSAGRTQQIPYLTPASLLTRLGARQVNPVLIGQRFVDGFPLQSRGDKKTHKIRNHQRNDHRVILCRFKDHEYRGHRCPDDAGKKRAHAYQGVGSRRRGVVRQ